MPTLLNAREAMVSDYQINERKTTKRLLIIWRHFEAYFGAERNLNEITAQLCAGYAASRMGAVARSTVWLEIQILKRAFHLCLDYGLLERMPRLPKIRGPTPRKGFLERDQFEAIEALVPPWHRPILEFLYWTGWRWSEAAELTWGAVDWAAGSVRLYPGESKSQEPRVFPFGALPALRTVLEGQRAFCTALQAAGLVVATVFCQPMGTRIASYRKPWRLACEKAGYKGKLVHDLRRSAVRRMELAGVPRGVAMALTGHRTQRIYQAYAIVAEGDLSEGVRRIAAYCTSKQEKVE